MAIHVSVCMVVGPANDRREDCDMGVHANVGWNRFPKQGELLGKQVRVMFDHDATTETSAQCVRDDMESPFLTIFRLLDGRYVTSSECQYR
jgi:hypothetical protein